MCYNYSLALFQNQREFEEVFDVNITGPQPLERVYYVNSFSIPKMPVISNEDPKQLHYFHWGLIPFWVKKEEDANKIRTQTMNARTESIFEKPSFRSSIRRKRCLVPADGFFEWRFVLGRNYPYYIGLKGKKLFAFAGIWDSWHHPENDETVYTYSIITCEPNNLLRKIHNKKKRMPVILPRDRQQDWLRNDLTEEEIKQLLVPYPDEAMAAYTISRLITSKTQERNVPAVIEPFSYPELQGID